MTVNRTLLTTLLLCLGASPLSAGEQLRWRLDVGDAFRIELESTIDKDERRAEAKIFAEIEITELRKQGDALGQLRFFKLHAIRTFGGSGVRLEGARLSERRVGCRLDMRGRLFLDPSDLAALEKGLEANFEELGLRRHFEGLLFALPEKAPTDEPWSIYHDGLAWELSVAPEKPEQQAPRVTIKGRPKASVDARETRAGELTVVFDFALGHMVSLTQVQSFKKTRGRVISSTERGGVKRSIKVTRLSSRAAKGADATGPACPECARRAPAGARFCPKDGRALTPPADAPRPCPRCGQRPPAGAKFCPKDGAALAPPPALPTCPKCQGQPGGGAKFCPKDGSALKP